jgi:hypothetical protein
VRRADPLARREVRDRAQLPVVFFARQAILRLRQPVRPLHLEDE